MIPTISGWRETPGTGNKDNTRWISTITYSADGDYTFAIDYTDLAGNICTSINYDPTTVSEKEFTIDKTVPVINVSYDNNASQNNNYYSDARTATIVITEHNFDASRVQINISAVDDGVAVVVPNISGWTTNGDRHSAQISYVNDALYTFDISCVDKAGNEAADFAQEVFYIDRTDPVLEIIGVENSKAYKGSVIPVIKYSDTNLDDSKVVITLTGVNRKSVKIEGTYSDIHNGRIFTFEDFAYEKEIDDIYTLKVEVTDKAGRKVSEKVDYSINRFGSTYSLSKNTEKLNGSYVQTTEDVVITEVNANKLSNIKITLFKNNQTIVLEQGTDYEMEVEGGGDQWYKYTYTIFKKNFEDDGVYRLTIHSEDEAGNVADNTIDTKNTEISFGVDKTPPTINIKDVADGETYALENLTAHMSVTDNLKLASVVVFLDGKEHKQWSKEEIDRLIANGEDFTFEISGDSTKAHTIRVVAVDEAGNGYTDEVKDFYITTDPLVRYYNNKPLFYGSISGVVGAAGVGGLFVALKRRKRKKEEEA